MASPATAKAVLAALEESFDGNLTDARLQYPGKMPGTFASLTETFAPGMDPLPLLQLQHVESGVLLVAHTALTARGPALHSRPHSAHQARPRQRCLLTTHRQRVAEEIQRLPEFLRPEEPSDLSDMRLLLPAGAQPPGSAAAPHCWLGHPSELPQPLQWG